MFSLSLPPEFELFEFIRSKVDKLMAQTRDLSGATLDLSLQSLPEVSEMESARETLVKWRSVESLAAFAGSVDRLLEVTFDALVVPDLFQRHQYIESARTLIKNDRLLSEACSSTKLKLDELYEASSRIDQVRGYLTSSAMRIGWCLNTWMPRSDDPESQAEGVARNFSLAVQRLIESNAIGDFFADWEK